MTAEREDRRYLATPAHRLDGMEYRLELAQQADGWRVGEVVDQDDVVFLLDHVRALTAERDALWDQQMADFVRIDALIVKLEQADRLAVLPKKTDGPVGGGGSDG